jgi:GNAT superfamily N-acetyltransferase
VLPAFRKQGIGSALIGHITHIAREMECGFIEWLVFDWNKSAQQFYERLGAQLRKDFIVCRLEIGAARPAITDDVLYI